MPIGTSFFLLLSLSAISSMTLALQWPQAPKQYTVRPTSNPYCVAGVIPFCPTGMKANTMPKIPPNDTLDVYALKAPVWEFKFGSLLKDFNIMHDAIGFHHIQSNKSYTMEWYELFQLFNCTFPHELQNNSLLWCNQGATCIYPSIDVQHWKQNGTYVNISRISGTTFNQFADWALQDNTTFPYYETWTVLKEPHGEPWFNPIDCASWVLRAFQKMCDFGAKFNQSVHLNYTKVVLYSQQPILLGNYSAIFSPTADHSVRDKLVSFYSYFQKEKSYITLLKHLLTFALDFTVDHIFYLYYNDLYWQLPMVKPYAHITYYEIPLPSKK